LETAVQAAEMHQADIVHFNYSKFDGSTFLKSSDFHTGSFAFYNDADRVSYMIQTLLSNHHGWESWDRIFRRNIIETHKIRCCTTCNNFGEDLAFICKYMLHAQKLICLPNQLYMYCVHPNSIMQKSFGIIRLNDMNEVSHDISLEFHRCIADSDTRLLFPIIHLMLVNDQIIGMGSRGEYPQLPAEIRKLHRLNWWKHNINTLYRCYPQLKKQFGTLPAQRAMLFTTYLQHGNWKLYCLECAIYHKLIKG